MFLEFLIIYGLKKNQNKSPLLSLLIRAVASLCLRCSIRHCMILNKFLKCCSSIIQLEVCRFV